MIYTSHTDNSNALTQGTTYEKEKIILRKYRLYAAGICAAVVLGVGGCASNASAGTTAATQESKEATKEETTVADTVVESVTGAIESMEESGTEAPQAIRIFGPVTRTEDGRLSIDNQSGVSNSGEIILNVSDEETYILDAVSGLPIKLEDIKDGDTIYAYIGPAMTMSLPPQTTGEVIIGKIPADQKAPEYITAVSMTANADGSWTLVSAAGKEYAVSADCRIMPYLTRQIVSLEDVEQGSNLLVWSDDQNQAQKLVLFAR